MNNQTVTRDPETLTQGELNNIFSTITEHDDGDPLAVERLKGHLTASGYTYSDNQQALRIGGWIVALWSYYF